MKPPVLSNAAPRILLLGAEGQLGWELARSLQPVGTVVALSRSGADLSDLAALATLVSRQAPQVIVNAAAWTAVDEAETHEAAATRINGEAPGVLADAAKRCGALLVHYSTDYVFDGSGRSAWREDAPPAPINAYGRGKLAGEQAIAQAGGDWLIFRTCWVYAARGRNFVRTMLRLGAQRDSLQVVDDQIGAPTSARLIADVTARAIAMALLERQDGRFHSAIHHLCAAGETSWYGLAFATFERWRSLAPDRPLALTKLQPIASAHYPTPARRPMNSRLDCSALEQRFALHLPHWTLGLDLVLAELAQAGR